MNHDIELWLEGASGPYTDRSVQFDRTRLLESLNGPDWAHCVYLIEHRREALDAGAPITRARYAQGQGLTRAQAEVMALRDWHEKEQNQ